jgi:hypothetical protein
MRKNNNKMKIMSDKILWKGGPSYLLLLPLIFKLVLWSSIGTFMYYMVKKDFFDEIMNSNFFLKFILGLLKNYGLYILYSLAAYIIYIQFQIIHFATRISCESYFLDKINISIKTGITKVEGQEINILNVINFEVEKPFYLNLFGLGHIGIYSSEETSDELSEFNDEKLIIMSGIKNPEKIERNLRAIIKKTKDNKLVS